jgi:hypothetical protein
MRGHACVRDAFVRLHGLAKTLWPSRNCISKPKKDHNRNSVDSVNVLSQVRILEGKSDVSGEEISQPFRVLPVSCSPYPEINIVPPIGVIGPKNLNL